MGLTQPDLTNMERSPEAPRSPSGPPISNAGPGGFPQNVFTRSPLPASLVGPVDTLRYFERPGSTRQFRNLPQPPNATPAIGATAASQAVTVVQQGQGTSLLTNNIPNFDQSELNLIAGTGIALAANKFGGVTITGAGGTPLAIGDTLIDLPQADPASIILVDDFYGFTAGSSAPASPAIGQLGWGFAGALSQTILYAPTSPPGYGALRLNSGGGSANNVSALMLSGFETDRGVTPGFALTYLTGWICEIVFQFPKWTTGGILNSLQKCRTYLGLGSYCVSSPTTAQARPAKFIGLRYDTDPGLTLTLSAAANASGGTTTYTGTIPNGTVSPSPYLNQNIPVVGFTNAANNGTFQCVSSTASQIVLANPSGVAESHAATATTQAISDTTLHFEFLQNFGAGNNLQGTVVNTGIAPDYNPHRLRMRSIQAGQVLMSIDGGTETIMTVSADSAILATMSKQALTAGNLLVVWGPSMVTNNIVTYATAIAAGTPLTVSGITGTGKTEANGSWVASTFGSSGSLSADLTNASPQPSSFGTLTVPFTGVATYHNSFAPMLCFGTDSEAGTTSVNLDIDYFAFIYNPKLAADFSGTTNPTLPRYFPAQT